MNDPRSPFAALRRELPADDVKREERHQVLATLLGAFADGELPAETASQIDAHLLGCPRCRRELTVHQTLRLRLEQEPLATAPMAFRDRIIATIAATPAPKWEGAARLSSTPAHSGASLLVSRLVQRMGRTAVVFGAVIGLAVAALGVRWVVLRNAAPRMSIVSASSVPLITAALADYRRVTRGDLPGRARDLAAIREAMPFPVQVLQDPSLRLLAAWTTSLNEQPAAVLAYRWNDHVVLQYFVSELQLYRPPELRRAFANGRALAAKDGAENVVAWPAPAWGSLLIGDVPLDRLMVLRETVGSR
jgi:anti-sigma factor RsiW